jgi:hypothetical protein
MMQEDTTPQARLLCRPEGDNEHEQYYDSVGSIHGESSLAVFTLSNNHHPKVLNVP